MAKSSFYYRLLILAVAAGLVIILAGCGGTVYPTPTFQSAPDVLTLEQLLAEYENNPEETSAKYEGRIFYFPSIYVKKMVSYNLDVRTNPNSYGVGNEKIWFKPDYIYDLDPIGIGFTVDILGVVQGWKSGILFIDQCSYYVVEGGELPPPAGY